MIFIRSSVVFILSFAVLYTVLLASHEAQREQQARSDWAAVTVTPPDSAPSYSQAAVDLAMTLFAIQMPRNTMPPKFDPNLVDRGLTVRRGWSGTAQVTVGPPAFKSWSLLGSTLAHELEVHCNQNFFLISMMDLMGLDGTAVAERQAYQHELAHAHRFGLSVHDQILIQDTLEFYYPEHRTPFSNMLIASQMTQSLQKMLSASLQARRHQASP